MAVGVRRGVTGRTLGVAQGLRGLGFFGSGAACQFTPSERVVVRRCLTTSCASIFSGKQPGRIDMRNVGSLALILAGAFPAFASAETWKAVGEFMPEKSAAQCTSSPTKVVYTLTIEGNAFSGTNTTGGKFSATMAPDGTVKTSYNSSFGGSSYVMELSGNAKAHQLETFNTKFSCRYKLSPIH